MHFLCNGQAFLMGEEHTEAQTKGNPSFFIMENHQLRVGSR